MTSPSDAASNTTASYEEERRGCFEANPFHADIVAARAGPEHLYRTIAHRNITFVDWPGSHPISGRELAEAGFYYTGHEDYVKCFECGLVLTNWREDDDPWIEHAYWMSVCDYVIRTKGREFVNDVHGEYRISTSREEEEARRGGGRDPNDSTRTPTAAAAPTTTSGPEPNPFREDIVAVSAATATRFGNGVVAAPPSTAPRDLAHKHSTYAIFSKRESSFDDWPVDHPVSGRDLAEAGFYYTGAADRVKCFECGVQVHRWKKDDDAWIEHARFAPRCPYVLRMKGPEFVVGNTRAAATTATSAAAIEEDRKTLCKICLDDTIGVIFLPCGHIVCCVTCAFSVNEICPICRGCIEKVTRVHFS